MEQFFRKDSRITARRENCARDPANHKFLCDAYPRLVTAMTMTMTMTMPRGWCMRSRIAGRSRPGVFNSFFLNRPGSAWQAKWIQVCGCRLGFPVKKLIDRKGGPLCAPANGSLKHFAISCSCPVSCLLPPPATQSTPLAHFQTGAFGQEHLDRSIWLHALLFLASCRPI